MKRLLPLIGLLAAGCIYLGQPRPQCPVAANPTGEEQTMLAALGKPDDLSLQRAAQLLADHEVDIDTSTLVDEYGNHLKDRLNACGLTDVDTRWANEVIPYGGDGSAAGVLAALQDPANAANVGDFWDAKYTNAGVAARQSGTTWYWVIVVSS